MNASHQQNLTILNTLSCGSQTSDSLKENAKQETSLKTLFVEQQNLNKKETQK